MVNKFAWLYFSTKILLFIKKAPAEAAAHSFDNKNI